MLRGRLLLGGLLLAAGFLIACSSTQNTAGGGGNIPSPPSPPAGTSQLSVTLSDSPPAGVSVLSFEVNITSALLQPTVGEDVSLLPNGRSVEIEVKKLETEAAVLSTISAPAGTYKGLQLALSDPTLTVQNASPNDIGSCKKNTICQIKPAATGPVSYSAAPFPLTLVAGAPVGLQIDILLDKIIGTDLSVTLNDPSDITVMELPAVPMSGTPAKLEDNEFAGMITTLDAANSKFVVQNSVSGMSETVNVDLNTKFEDFDEHGCQSKNFSCLSVTQTVEVETTLNSDGSILAKEVKLEESSGAKSVDGTVVSVTGNPPNQLQMVVLDEEPELAGLHPGNSLTVDLSGTLKFDIGLGRLAVPAGGSFAGPGDLLPGQNLQIEPGTIAPGPPISTSTSHVTLHTSQFTATVSAVNGSAVTVTNLPALFGLTTLVVESTSNTEFEDLLGPSSLTNGSVISVRALLFNTASGPVVVAAKIRGHSND
jgi:Domain of unknown function (DUF5666)